jgi:DNA-binding CsgD family transcriptional regulator
LHQGHAQLRYAEALLAAGGGRTDAEAALRAAHGTALAIGAAPLQLELEALARRARIDLEDRARLAIDRADAVAVASPVVLTAREREVLRHVAGGHTNREIGDRLFISEKTVSVHVSNAMAKLGALSRYEAAASAERLGLL